MRASLLNLLLIPALLINASVAAANDSDTPFWGGPDLAGESYLQTDYRDDTPTLESVAGHAPGERISRHDQIHAYFSALTAAHPDRIEMVPYATSWEGRELFFVIIGSAERMASLSSLRADIQTVASADSQATALIEQLPATVWLSYSVHGNEISSSDAAILTAYHLLAAQDDPVVETILDQSLVFIDPLQNPDGRDRFIHQFEAASGLQPAASRLAAEHDEPWPSGRVNHYLFDLNRDWLALTQPETIGKVAAIQRWYPLVYVDAHEMGSDSTYFFAPEAIPYNPQVTAAQRRNLERFGRGNAEVFDRFGIDYFTREVFDAFYPGYGASWPSYYGAVAMTYEQASSRGLRMRRRNGSEFHYRDTVRNHFLSSIATAHTAATHRQQLWSDFLAYRRSASRPGGIEGPGGFVIPAQTDQGGADDLARTLARHGIDVRHHEDSLSACGNDYPDGAYVVSTAQPAGRLVRTLLDPEVAMEESFVSEQERLRRKNLPDDIYDVTAWSLPLMFNVDMTSCRRVPAGGERLDPEAAPSGQVDGRAGLAYVVAGGDRSASRFLAHALRAGLTVLTTSEAFRQTEREFPRGSLIIPVDQPGAVHERVAELAAASGANVTAFDHAWMQSGPNFGSRDVVMLSAPRIALAWDRPTDTYAPGAVRFVIERQFGYPLVPIRTHTLADADLGRFDVVILPDSSEYWGSYQSALGEKGRDNLKQWVDNGGVLVTLAGATAWAALPDVDLLAARAEDQARPETQDEQNEGNKDPSSEKAAGNNDDDKKPERVPGILIPDQTGFETAIRPESEAPDSVAGVFVKAVADPDHWLTAGVAEELNVLVRGQRILQPIPLDKGRNVVRYAGPEDLWVSGYLWEENRRQLAYKPFVIVQPRERGMVIAFTEDPAVRAYLNGLNTLLINAVLRAPAYTDKLR